MNPTFTLIVRAIISILATFAFGMVLYMVMQPGAVFSPSAEKVTMFVLGALTTVIVGIMNYWFGSTQGSTNKTNQMYR